MCGIVGIASKELDSSKDFSLVLRSSLEKLEHRGPDNFGIYQDEQVILGHARLSIIDLSSSGHQPMSTEDERYIICYNGEVYNFGDLRQQYGLNNLFSKTDTEVVLKAFAKVGVEVFRKLNGMFAFAIYDKEENKIWLVRDRLGIKPLYYTYNGDQLKFASEIEALLEFSDERVQCNREGLHEWLYYGTTLGERTLLKDVKKLEPGNYLELSLESLRLTIRSYWSPKEYVNVKKERLSKKSLIVGVKEKLEQAVKRQLVSDVPVGVFLSGGIDSSAITAFASKYSENKIDTFSVGFDFDKGVNELPKARSVAQYCNTNHHEFHVSGKKISDVVEKMVWHHGHPFSDAANIPLYLLSSEVEGKIKVVLQGDGGDELFAGYRRYSLLRFYKLIRVVSLLSKTIERRFKRGFFNPRIDRMINAFSANSYATTMALLLTEEDEQVLPFKVFGDDIADIVTRENPFSRYLHCQEELGTEDTVNQMLFVDSMIILPDIFLEKVDRSTMASSIEVRVPFLDNDLVDFCLKIPGYTKASLGRKKWLLKKALEGTVPQEILYGPKTGFGVPYGFWLVNALKGYFFDYLETFDRKYPGFFDSKRIADIFYRQEKGEVDQSFLLWKVLNFMVWSIQKKVVL